LVGCSSPKAIAFRVVDSETGEPLQGVRVARNSHNASFFSGPVNEYAQLPPTGGDGQVIATNLRRASAHYFTFNKEGYQPSRAATGGANWRTINIYSPWLHPGPQVREWTPPEPPVEQRLRGVIRIPLHKRDARLGRGTTRPVADRQIPAQDNIPRARLGTSGGERRNG
jgi:hypothetical protein